MKQKYSMFGYLRRLTVVISTLFCVSIMAQVQSDKVISVPTVEGDPSTEFLMLTHLCDSGLASDGTVPTITDSVSKNLKSGAFVEYQIRTPIGAEFAVNLNLSAEREDALVNVGIYKTETEAWPADGLGDTVRVAHIRNTERKEWYVSLIDLEPDEVYTLRINFMNANDRDAMCRLNGIVITEITCCSYPSKLGDLRMNGNTIPGFDPNITLYKFTLDSGVWVDSISATAQESSASVEIIENLIKADVNTRFIITIRSGFGFVMDYRINAVVPVTQLIKVDKVRILPTIAGDPSSEFLIASHVTDSVMTFDRFDPDLHFTDDAIIFTSANDYVEYQIFSPFGGTFIAVLNIASKAEDASVNVSAYKTESELWSESGMTNNAFNDSWSTPQQQYFVLELEEAVLYTMRISFFNAPSHLFGINTWYIGKIRSYTLSDLKINGTTVPGFDPEKYVYNVAMPIGTTSVNVEAQTTGYSPSKLTGTGTIELSGFKTVDTIRIEYINGITKEYALNLFTPIEVTDGLELAMADHLFNNNGTSLTDSLITDMTNGDYVEYYIYSATDKDVHLTINSTNGNRDNIYSRLNLQSYIYGSDWLYTEVNSSDIPHQTRDMWTVDYASDLNFKLSLRANEPLVMRLYGVTNAPQTLANIFGLSVHDSTSNSIESATQSGITVFGGANYLTVLCDEGYVGGSIQIFDISGRLIVEELLHSTSEVYTIKQSGLYILKVVGKNKEVRTSKCIVK